jgi:hypothetical protein
VSENKSPNSGRTSAELEWICRSTLQSAYPFFRNIEVHACFYPYIGLTHTIRRNGTGWMVRISDHCARAPRIVLEAIALILAAKVLRRRPPVEMSRAYDRFRLDPDVEAAVEARRRSRGRKLIRDTAGRHHSLMEIYREVNHSFFDNQVEIRKLGWGPRRSWGRLGHYDPVHHTITVSPVLDSPRVPRSVVSYIVYHEMLHTLFDSSGGAGGRKRHHPPEFRKAERAHPDYLTAKRFLDLFYRTRGKV